MIILIGLLAAQLTGCSFGVSDQEAIKDYQDQISKLQEENEGLATIGTIWAHCDTMDYNNCHRRGRRIVKRVDAESVAIVHASACLIYDAESYNMKV